MSINPPACVNCFFFEERDRRCSYHSNTKYDPVTGKQYKTNTIPAWMERSENISQLSENSCGYEGKNFKSK